MSVKILRGDCREVLRSLPNESVQCVVTSPPYWGLRDYGIPPSLWDDDPDCEHEWGEHISVNATNHTTKARWNHTRNGRDELQPTAKRVSWLRTEVKQGQFCQRCGAWAGALGLEPDYRMFVEHLVEVFRDMRRVLRTDGTIWLNLGDSYATGAGAVGEHPGGGEQGERWKGHRGTHTTENSGKAAPRIATMGPMTQPNRMPQAGLKAKDLCGVPWRVALALQAEGWWLRQDIIWAKPNPMPESVQDRCTKSHEYIFLLAKADRYYFDAEAIAERAVGISEHDLTGQGYAVPGQTPHTGTRRSGNKERKPASARGVPVDTGGRSAGAVAGSVPWEGSTRNKRSVWTVGTKPYPEAHFATFPPELVEPCILAGCPKDGVVLDPFAGAGTTGLVADRLGRNAILIELNPEYADMAKRRITGDAGMFAEVSHG